MLTRKNVITFCAVLFGVSLTIQMYLFYCGSHLHPIDVARTGSRAYNTIKKFLALTNESQVQAFFVDPYILQGIVEETFQDGMRPCRFMCKNHIYTFAVQDSSFDRFNAGVLHVLRDEGFELRADYKSGSEGLVGEMPTHVVLRDHDHHAIHVVIFYKRNEFWWYGPDKGDEYGLGFTQHEGAIDIFEADLVPVDGIDVYIPQQPKLFLEEYQKSRFIPCNQTRAAEFYKLYPRDESKNATKFNNLVKEIIHVTKRRLDHFGIPFWLSSGTLLGWFRQCDVISYSMDVDIGVYITDHKPDLLKMLKTTGMQLDHKFGKVEDSLQYAFDMGDAKLDIFFFYEDKSTGKMWNGGTDYNSGRKYRYFFDKFTLCWTEFLGMKARVPCDTERYVRANYGPDWFKPVKKWDWKDSPYNVKEVDSWRDSELDEVIQLFDKKGNKVLLEWINDEL